MTQGPSDDRTSDDETAGSTREANTHSAEDDESRERDRTRPEDSPDALLGDRDEDRTPAVEESEKDGDWKFPLDSLSGDEEEDENSTGTLARNEPLEPGNIDPENAFFVAVGVLLVVGLILGAMFGF